MPGGTASSGALTEDLIDTSKESRATIAACATPGGAFGSARYKLAGLETRIAPSTSA